MSKKISDSPFRKPLADHVRVGKKFIPPLKRLKGLLEVRYDLDILPEIIWMGLVNDEFGIQQGTEIIARFCEIAYATCPDQGVQVYTFAGDYSCIGPECQARIVSELQKEGLLRPLSVALAPLAQLYDGFPLGFLMDDKCKASDKDLVSIMRVCVERHSDKYKTPSLVIQADVLYVQGLIGKLLFPKDMEVPDLNSLIERPNSDAAAKTAAFVRSGVLNMLATPDGLRKNDWGSRFWNQNLSIDACEFVRESDD